MNTYKLLLCYLIALVSANCSCNSTNINQIYPCACQDYEGYQICKQAYNTAINYTNTLSNLVKPHLHDYDYINLKNNMALSFSGFYCTSVPTCYVNSSIETCKKNTYYYECNLFQNLVLDIGNESSEYFIDTNIKNIIKNLNSQINVVINCNTVNKNYIIVNSISKDTYFKNNSGAIDMQLCYIIICISFALGYYNIAE